MAKAASPADEHAEGDPKPAPAARGSIMGRLLVVVLVLVVVVVECVVACLCIPAASTQATEQAANPLPKSTADLKKQEPPELRTDSEAGEMTEVDLGDCSVTVFQPASNSTLRIDFHVFGTVETKEKKEFDELYEKHKQRVREQVNTTIRSAEIADLSDPSLGLIKRSILDKARQILGKPILRDVVIPDFSFVEQ